MPRLNKRTRQLAAVRVNRHADNFIPKHLLNSIDIEDSEYYPPRSGFSHNNHPQNPAAVHLLDNLEADNHSGEETEEEFEYSDTEDTGEFIPERVGDNLVARLKGLPAQAFGEIASSCRYARGPTASKRTQRRGRREQRERLRAAAGCRPLTAGFLISSHDSGQPVNSSSYHDTQLVGEDAVSSSAVEPGVGKFLKRY